MLLTDLRLVRGSASPKAPLWLRLKSALPPRLGGDSLPRLMLRHQPFEDQRDLMEWLHVRLHLAVMRIQSLTEVPELQHCICNLEWNMKSNGAVDLFRPGVQEVLAYHAKDDHRLFLTMIRPGGLVWGGAPMHIASGLTTADAGQIRMVSWPERP